jgi:hypothetical protein
MSRRILFAAILSTLAAISSGTAHAAGHAWDVSGAYVRHLEAFNLARAEDRAALRVGIDKVARMSVRLI